MKNELYYGDGQSRGLRLPLPVPAGTVAGRPTVIGPAADPLLVIPMTDRASAVTRARGEGQGLRDGEASCFIPGFGQVLNLGAIPEGAVAGQKVYLSAAGTLTLTNTDLYVGRVIPLPLPLGGFGVAIRYNT